MARALTAPPVPLWKAVRADAARYFSPDEVARAKSYQRPLQYASLAGTLVTAGVIAAIVWSEFPRRLLDQVGVTGWVWELLIVMAAYVVLAEIAGLPLSIWKTFVHEQKWGFNTQTPKGFVGDLVKGIVLGMAIQTPLLLALWWLIRTTELWWVWGWAVFFCFSVLLAFLFPVVIMPLFNKFTPLEDETLSSRLRALAEGVGMKVSGVQVMDASKRTKKDNAFFAGVGGTRRIVVFDNLLAQPHPVIASVVAHELGHWRRRHIARSIALGAVTSLLIFGALRVVATWDVALEWAGVSSVADPASLPLVVLVFVSASALTGLVQSWVSRAFERQADLDALEFTRDYDAFFETEHGLSTRNLIDLAPTWWRYIKASHPPPAERLELGKMWRERQSTSTR